MMQTQRTPHSAREPKVIAVYVRVSTDAQADNWSVDEQRDLASLPAVLPFLKRGYRPVVYDDLGISGERISNRPKMRQLLDDLEAGLIGAVVATDWNRLSRDQYMRDGLAIIEALDDASAVFITPDKVYDPNSDADCFSAQVQLLLAAAQKSKNVKAMTRGQYRKAKAGGFAGGTCPYGYLLEFTEPHRDGRPRAKLAIDPEEAAVVRRIFVLYVEGLPRPDGIGTAPMTMKGIATLLNKEGLRVRCRKSVKRRDGTALFKKGDRRPFEEQDIRRWLHLRPYIGLFPWSEGELVESADGGEPVLVRSRHLRDLPELEVLRPDLQIVDTGLWSRAQALRQERAQGPRRTACTDYALAGLLSCPVCRGPMGSALQTKRDPDRPGESLRQYGYTCLDHKRFGQARCRGSNISERAARAAVEALLLEQIALVDLRRWLDEAAEERKRKVEGRLADEYRTGLQEVARKLDNLVRAVANGDLTGDDVRAQRLELMEERDDLQRRLRALEAEREDRNATQTATATARLAADPGAYLAGLSGAEFRRIARAVLERITVVGEGAGKARRARVEHRRLSRAWGLATGQPQEPNEDAGGTFECQPSAVHSQALPEVS
jgi:site-specific DNA recombinase